MPKTEVVKLGRTPEKWLKLMLHLQNSIPSTFRLVFTDEASASDAGSKLNRVIQRQPTWFNTVITRRGCDIYIIKTQGVQKVVIEK
jgi:hypothetical protein